MKLSDRILILKHGRITETYVKENINEAKLLRVITTIEGENETNH